MGWFNFNQHRSDIEGHEKLTRWWKSVTTDLGGGNSNIILFSPRKLGKMNPIWRAYFSKGLKLNHQLDKNQPNVGMYASPIGCMGDCLRSGSFWFNHQPETVVQKWRFFFRSKSSTELLQLLKGVEMSSTGEVACFGVNVHEAFLKGHLIQTKVIRNYRWLLFLNVFCLFLVGQDYGCGGRLWRFFIVVF